MNERKDGRYITPWGDPISVRPIAKGVYQLLTYSHIGYYLEPFRNDYMPMIFNRPDGFYSSTACIAVASIVHPDVDFGLTRQQADDYVRQFLPFIFEGHYNCTILPTKSIMKDRYRIPDRPGGRYHVVDYKVNRGENLVYLNVVESFNSDVEAAAVSLLDWEQFGPFSVPLSKLNILL